jgi:UDP:flavonoid glycosyltransferase YjiC (YdhE family)
LLLTRHAEQIPKTLPAGVKHVPYVPFSELLPHVAALVHHGGIGTTAQALAAGCPQLIMPLAHDQFDNAQRVGQLRAGLSISRNRYTARAAADRLTTLLNDASLAEGCRRVADRFVGVDAIDTACETIERFAARHEDSFI